MASQPAVVVTVDGELRDPQAPLLYADDLAVVRGDGIFESLLVRDGRPCLLEAHLGRLTQSARMADLPEPDLPAWREAVTTAASTWTAQGGDEGVLRLDVRAVPSRRPSSWWARCLRAWPTPVARAWPR